MSDRAAWFAHSTGRADRADWQPLAEHLRGVADLVVERAAKFGAGDWGYVAGLLLGAARPHGRRAAEGRAAFC